MRICVITYYCKVVVGPGAQFYTLLDVWVLGVGMSTLGAQTACTPRIGVLSSSGGPGACQHCGDSMLRHIVPLLIDTLVSRWIQQDQSVGLVVITNGPGCVCLLCINKTRTKDKTYVSMSV